MTRQTFFWLLGLFLQFCAISSRTRDSFNESENFRKTNPREEWEIVDSQDFQNYRTTWKDNTDWSEGEIDANKIGCWRYCVKKSIFDREMEVTGLIRRINIVWNIVDKAKMTLKGKTSSNWGIFPDQDTNLQWESSSISSEKLNNFNEDDPKCEMYIELGCNSIDKSNFNNSTIIDVFSNSDEKELVSKNYEVGYSSNAFSVDETIGKLKILAFGKISRVVLEIPIAPRTNDFTDASKTKPTFSLSRTSDAKGLLIDARNPPPGQWRLNLFGMEYSNYNFTVTASPLLEMIDNLNTTSNITTNQRIGENEDTLENEFEKTEEKKNAQLSISERQIYVKTNNDDDAAGIIKSDDEQLENEENSTTRSKILNSSNSKEPSARALILETNKTKFSRKENIDAEMMITEIDENIEDENIDEKARILDDGTELDELSRITELALPRKKTVIDLNPSTELILRPGTYQDIVFTVTNNQALDIRHTFLGSSRPFPYIGVIPNAIWIRSGETINVAVRIQVPNVENTEPNIVTLYVRGGESFDVVEKSAYVYVQGSRGTTTTDSEKPNIDYTFNDNCAGKLHRDRCAKSRWSVEITVHDSDSGLKRVTSLPIGIEPRTEFISGTKNKVNFYYSSSCCYTTVDITAIDVQGNSYTRTIDVTAWDNLSPGEIAAIVVGALLILLLIVFIIVMIIYCIRKRKSHDLSYSQRYGSRTPASTERSNF